jgi:hypothetical protein
MLITIIQWGSSPILSTRIHLISMGVLLASSLLYEVIAERFLPEVAT